MQVDKLRTRHARSNSLEKVELEPKSFTPIQGKRVIRLLRKGGQTRSEAGSRSCGQTGGPVPGEEQSQWQPQPWQREVAQEPGQPLAPLRVVSAGREARVRYESSSPFLKYLLRKVSQQQWALMPSWKLAHWARRPGSEESSLGQPSLSAKCSPFKGQHPSKSPPEHPSCFPDPRLQQPLLATVLALS